MCKLVFVVDCSGSMGPYLGNIKEFLKDLVWGLPDCKVALIHFNQKVYIGSYYSQDPAALGIAIENMSPGGCTGLHDAIHVAIAFEGPTSCVHECPDKLIVFSDGHDNSSCTSEDNWIEKVEELGIDVFFYPLEPFYNSIIGPYVSLFTKTPIKVDEALANLREITKRTKRVKIIDKPVQFLDLVQKAR